MSKAKLGAIVAILLVFAIVLGALALVIKALKWLLILAAIVVVISAITGWVGARKTRT